MLEYFMRSSSSNWSRNNNMSRNILSLHEIFCRLLNKRSLLPYLQSSIFPFQCISQYFVRLPLFFVIKSKRLNIEAMVLSIISLRIEYNVLFTLLAKSSKLSQVKFNLIACVWNSSFASLKTFSIGLISPLLFGIGNNHPPTHARLV